MKKIDCLLKRDVFELRSTEEVIKGTKKWVAQTYNPLEVAPIFGKGVWVRDSEEKQYLDMLSCYSAQNLGYNHPEIVEAIKRFLGESRIPSASRAFYNDQLDLLGEELSALCGQEMILPKVTGVEGVEAALKTARKWGYEVKGISPDKAEIITCQNNFHGRTIAVIGFSTEEQYKRNFGPFPGGFKNIPFGDAEALEKAITKNTAAFLAEPIQGEGGVIVAPTGYLREVRKICSAKNVLLIADEIQTGFGRTGKLFAYQHEDIKPDIVIVAKSLGASGFVPTSAILTSKKIMGLYQPGDDGSTHGGMALACILARTGLRVIMKEKLSERSAKLGQYFVSCLKAVRSPHVLEIRGSGLMLGLELKPESGGARHFCESLKTEGLLCKDTHANVIRFMPPLIITREEIDWAVEKIKKVLGEN